MQHVVHVLYRAGPGYCLILGVFQSAQMAREYVERMGAARKAAWDAPRPGRDHWHLDAEDYAYLIEEHVIRDTADPPLSDQVAPGSWLDTVDWPDVVQ